MQYGPNVDMIIAINIETQIGEFFHGPEAEARKIKFMRIAWGASRGVTADMGISLFQRIDKI
jgi:hypothetical protein